MNLVRTTAWLQESLLTTLVEVTNTAVMHGLCASNALLTQAHPTMMNNFDVLSLYLPNYVCQIFMTNELQ